MASTILVGNNRIDVKPNKERTEFKVYLDGELVDILINENDCRKCVQRLKTLAWEKYRLLFN